MRDTVQRTCTVDVRGRLSEILRCVSYWSVILSVPAALLKNTAEEKTLKKCPNSNKCLMGGMSWHVNMHITYNYALRNFRCYLPDQDLGNYIA